MNMMWKVGAAAVTVAVVGGFLLGRVAAREAVLPDVGDPVTVGSTVAPTATVTPSDDAPTLRPKPRRTRSTHEEHATPRAHRTREPEPGDDNGGDRAGDDNSGSGGSGDGRGRGRGRGSDDVRTISPSPSEITPEDVGDDHGGGDGGSGRGGGGGGDDD